RVAAAGHEATTGVAFSRKTPTKYQVYHEVIAGGWGASMYGDGCDGIAQPLSNTGNTPIEVMEVENEFARILSYGLITGAGGEGRFRGGMGMHRKYEILEEGVLFCSNGDRLQTPPWGVDGGKPGSKSAFRIVRGGETTELSALNTMPVRKGDIIIVETC